MTADASQLRVVGEGRPLVLVPGMDGTGLLFYRQVPLLARRFRVATYRLRDGAASMDALVDDLADVVARVSPDGTPAVIVGESFGGALALSFALARPELVDSLVVVNSFPRFLPQARLHLAVHALRLVPWSVMGLVRRLTAARLHSRHTHREEIRRFLTLTASTTRRGYVGRLRALIAYDARADLARVGVPTLFLASDDDRLVPAVEQAEYMAARVPGAAMRRLEGHGHICLIAPDVDLDAILAEWEAARDRGEA